MSTAPQEPSGAPVRDEEPPLTYAGMPGWVKWLLVVVVVLALMLVVVLLVGGDHGPGRHMSHELDNVPVAVSAAASASTR